LFLVGRFPKIFSSETTWSNQPKFVGGIYSNLYWWPSIDTSYQFIWVSGFRGENVLYFWPIRN
jgi:hypothetical protein